MQKIFNNAKNIQKCKKNIFFKKILNAKFFIFFRTFLIFKNTKKALKFEYFENRQRF